MAESDGQAAGQLIMLPGNAVMMEDESNSWNHSCTYHLLNILKEQFGHSKARVW